MTQARRVAIGGIFHETHTFMEQATTLADFRTLGFTDAGEVVAEMRGTRSGIGGMLDAATMHGWQIVPLPYCTAMPSGTVTTDAYQVMRARFLTALRAGGPVDGVLLVLHGAMVAAGMLDVETDLARQVRAIIGADVPVVAELDMHANLSPQLSDYVNVINAYDTNPHIDTYERGVEAAHILNRLMEHDIRPTAAYAHTGLLLPPQQTGTADPPLLAVHQRVAAIEAQAGVICVAVLAGFAYGDTPDAGASILVTTDNDPRAARRYADELAVLLREQAQKAQPDILPADVAVQQALARAGGPVILVDSADNIGGGTPGDGTDALAALLRHPVHAAAVVINDPEAVQACWAAGKDATIALHVGGKQDRWHGAPVAVEGQVIGLSDGVFTCEQPDNHFAAFYGSTVHMGPTAWLRVGGVNILLTMHKTPPFDLAQFRHIGIQPEQQQMIVVKSAVAYRAAYLPIAAGVIEMDTAGLCSANLSRFPYQHARAAWRPSDA